MAEGDKLRYEKELRDIIDTKIARKKEQPVLPVCEDGMPKRPPSAYVMFAKDVRAVLK